MNEKKAGSNVRNKIEGRKNIELKKSRKVAGTYIKRYNKYNFDNFTDTRGSGHYG